MEDPDSSNQTTVIPRKSSTEKTDRIALEKISFEEWDRYRVSDFLGKGATSEVYKATDPSLNRNVALKFILQEDLATEKRFIREARAQAQIDHPHVCKIHEVGTFCGKHYIAMQFIEGEILATASGKMTLEQKLLVMKQVAEAVHAAHKMGIIHRDIKPSNIMVEKTDAGWYPYVLDFGLARETAMEGATVTSMVLGTPAFMPPEQAWGDQQKVDRRSDVYSLGATLYSILASRSPYEGNTMEVILKLSQEDPVPLRKIVPQIPRDLETIVMKSMERNPDRRYDSAKSFAEDLARYLNGDSIQARPASVIYRLSKKIKKHKTIAAVVVISSLLVLAFGGAGIFSWWRTAKQVRVAKEFIQIAENMEWRMRVARMAPLHNITQDKEQVASRMSTIRQRIQEAGSMAEGPGNYALGRGWMELSKFDQARNHLQKAWNSGYQTPENAYALGLTLGHLYQRELEAVQRIESPTQKKLRMKQLQTEYLQPVVGYLRNSKGAEPAIQEYIEGLIAFYEKKYPEALQKAKNAQKKLWWLYEAGKLEGDVYMDLGVQESDRANYEEAVKHYSEAGNAFQRAILIARSEPSLYESDCWKWLQIMKAESERGGSMKEPMEKGLSTCDFALAVDPESAVAYGRKAQIWWRWGDDLYYRGEYSDEAVDNSIRFAQAAVQRNSEDFYSHFELGNAYHMKMVVDLSSGRDPNIYANKAIQYFNNAAKLNPDYSATFNNLGGLLVDFSQYEVQHQRDPRIKLEEAIKNCRKAAKIAPESVAAHNTLGNAFIILSDYEKNNGIDPESSLKQAIHALDNARNASPKHPTPFLNLGTAYLNQAVNELNRGRNPENSVRYAVDNGKMALELGGEGYATANSIIGSALLVEAKYRIYQGLDPGDLLKKPIEYSLKTLKSGSNEGPLAYSNLIDTYHTEAEYRLVKNQNPTAILTEVRVLQKKAAAEFPDSDLPLWESRIEILSARWNLQSGRSPISSLEKAADSASRVLQKNSNNASALAALAEISEVRAEWLQRQNKAIDDVVFEGLSNVRKALVLNPSLSETVALAGKLHWLDAQGERNMNRRDESKRLAIESLQKAISMNANLQAKYLLLVNQIK